MQNSWRQVRTAAIVVIGSVALIALWAGIDSLAPEIIESASHPAPRAGEVRNIHRNINRQVQANQGRVDLVFVGDSITEYWRGPGREVWEHYYRDRRALNLGVRGDRTQHVLWRLENGNLNGIKPEVAVVMIGTNNLSGFPDTVADIVDGVTAVVEKLQVKVPGIKVLLLDILPRGQTFNVQREKIRQINAQIRTLHDGETVVYLPIGQYFLEPDGTISKTIMPDFLHLSAAGYAIWAAKIEPTLSAMLGDDARGNIVLDREN